MPILQMHGNIDAVVPYIGAAWTKPIDDVIEYWRGFNNCLPDAVVTDIPNTSILDGSTVEHFVHADGDNGATTEHFKISGGGHTWPGTAFVFAGTNLDIDASFEIWKFFSRYDINGLIETTAVEDLSEVGLNIYPNPTSSFITLEMDFSKNINYEVVSVLGNVVLKGVIEPGREEVDLSGLAANVYFLKMGNRVFKILKTN